MYTLNHKYENDELLVAWLNKHDIPSKEQCLVQFFCGIPTKIMMNKIARILTKNLPKAYVLGSTTDGEIFEEKVKTKNIIINCSVFEKSVIRSCGLISNSGSYSLGEKIAKTLSTEKTKSMILFTSGLTTNGEQFLDGVYSVSKGKFTVSGGMAGDNANFKKTYVSYQDEVYKYGAVGVSIEGDDLRVMNNYQFGWKQIGLPMKITKATENRVYEIENQPAIEVYKKYLGARIAKKLLRVAMEMPLIVERNESLFARTCIKKYGDGSLLFSGDIKEGEKVSFGIGDIEMILSENRSFFGSFEPQSVFLYSSMARRRLLKSKSSYSIKNTLQPCSLSGFYTYGEFFSDEKSNYLFNNSMTVLALSETEIIDKNNTCYLDTKIEIKVNSVMLALSNLTNVITNEWKERLEIETMKNKRQEHVAFEQNKLAQMGEMVNMIAHQWRQPLNALSATAINISLLSSMGKLEENKIQESSVFIQDQCQKMSNTIDTFMDFVKPPKEKKIFKLLHPIESIMNIIGAQLSNHNIAMTISSKQQDVYIEGYEYLLEQVITNILTNAKDAFYEIETIDKKIDISVEVEDNIPKIVIVDNAGGIPVEIRNKIFNPYFTTKEQGKGIGIGLFMSLDIMRKNFNGDLKYVSVENGSKFEIIFEKLDGES